MDKLTEVQNKLKQLREKYCDAQDRSRELVDLDPKKMTEAEAAELRGLNAKMLTLKGQIEPLIAEEIRLLGQRGISNPYGDLSGRTSVTLSSSLDDADPEPEQRGGPVRNPTYRNLFFRDGSEIPRSEFRNGGEFCEIISSGLFDPRLVRSTMDSDGSAGYSIPVELASTWWDLALEEAVVLPNATVYPMNSATLKVPAFDDDSRASGQYFGGLALTWTAETATSTPQSAKLRLMTLNAKKGAIYCDTSAELAQDGQGFDQQISNAMKKALAAGLDYSFLQGSGAGMPLGILNADCTITVDAEVGQAADSVVFENITKMFSRMWAPGRTRGVWIANATTLPWLLSLHIPVGTGGSVVQVLNEKDGKFTLLGRPIIFTENLPEAGGAGDIVFADLSQYIVGVRKEMAIEKSVMPGWYQDLQSYRVILRADGQPAWDEPLTPRSGTATVGPFVVLGAR